ncbi:uncharacterized protein LOC121512193 [Cheilinus undulatus]|uniref:uncharacterized protein LOC121512193 n=1 Tax=Cheilinus undulatus TaxID=241271 RepID=UPI001BD32D2A|nr:uncharacterized protein LOC121512193 [Cheilinus undulatus]
MSLSRSGVRLHPVNQRRSEGPSSLSAHLSDSSSVESAVGTSRRRRPPVATLPRRLRFEDETETEAESRYLERLQQTRRVGQRGTGVLVSKPELSQFANGNTGTVPQGAGPQGTRAQGAGPQDAECAGEGKQRGWMPQSGQCDSNWTVLGGGANLNVRRYPPVAGVQGLYRPSLSLRTEPIRETYIGSVTYDDKSKGGAKSGLLAKNQMTNQVGVNGNHVTIPQTKPKKDLPINPYPYEPKQLTTPTQPSVSPPPAYSCHQPTPPVPPPSAPPPVTSAKTSQIIRINSTKTTKNLNQFKSTPSPARTLREPREGAELKEKAVCVEDKSKEVKSFSSSFKSNSAESQALPTPGSSSSSDVQLGQPLKTELHNDDSSPPEHSMSRHEPDRLSLRRLFANVKLGRTRSASLDRLCSRPSPSAPVPDSAPDPAPSCPRKSSSLLKKTPSVPSLSVGASFMSLRKSSSVQSLRSEQKKKKDRSADYRPAADQCVQRRVSIDDVGRPSSARSVGRVIQICSDGTFLLEISRLKNRTFGFIISRGKGRPNSGVYVEDMADSSTQKLYGGLLEVGDEIVEVNGETVACLTLDQVTSLLTQTTTTNIRVLRHQRLSPQ